MRRSDGSVAIFASGAGPKKACALIERRDPDGHVVKFVRNAAGNVSRMESEGKSITLEYDERQRIVRAYDTSKNEVAYTYDDGGRLVRAAKSDGTVRRYGYDSRNYLTRVEEPGRIVENRFDESGRWARQVVKSSEDDPDPYVASARYVVSNGSVVESAFDEGGGLEVHRYNAQHYTVSETLFATSPTPVTFRYGLDANNASKLAVMSCTGRAGPVTREVQLTVHDDDKKAEAIRGSCVVRR
jgi:YD repeat-containing protein